MKKNFIRMLSLLLTLCLGIAYLPSIASVAAQNGEDYETVEVWKRTDIILKSKKEYDNPYKDVDIDAVFTHEDGTTIHLYGFWNGADEWRVRFSPTKVGLWSYEITCSDTDNKGLHQQKGKILAVENSGNTDLDKHGFVRISDNGRYFVYDDGTPFYWLGDTNWQAPNYVSITQCNYPGCACGNQFLHELNDRLAKGFTVYQTYFDSGESDGGGQLATTSEPSMWLDKYDSVNPETFSKKFDVMFDTLADCGMVIALGFGVHSNTTESMGKENLDRISRYLTARYASYPVVWITAQEITGNPQYSLWLSSAKIVDEGDGYNHPQGAHMFPMDVNNSYVSNLDKQSWHEFYALQNGHGPTIPTKALYEGYWNNTGSGKVKPFIETEANYEDISCGSFNGYDASRIAAWKANLSGSYGFTYGVTGIWANNYSTAGNTGWLGSFSYEPWYMGLDKPGSYEMTYLASFFKYVDFSSLIPRFNDETYSNLTDETKVVASSEDGRTYVAYFYNSGRLTGELRGLKDNETYSAKWYNPLTGKFVEISDEITVKGGVYTIPEKPTSGDWALLVTSRTDLGEYSTENAYTDALIDNRTNFASESTATVSTDNGEKWSAASAIDGDLSTYWCASDGKMPQWFILDMKEARKFAEIDLILYPGNEYDTEYASFTVEGSMDGVTYTALYTADKAVPTPYRGKDLFRITQDGEYRYLKVTFTEIKTNWATLCEIAVYDAPSEENADDMADVNILSGAVATASSFSAADSAPGKAIDGSGSSWWCASSGNMPQWIAFDLKEARPFNRFSFVMYGGTTSVSYRIEGSMDQENWTTIHEGVKEEPVSVGNSVQIAGETDEICSYRYLRITFTEVVGNWATIVEADFHLTKDGDPLPDYDGVRQTPGVISTGSYIYSAKGQVRDTAGALFDADLSTEWVPYAPIGSQTILMDLRETKELYGIHIVLGKNASLPEYRIEASVNGTDWVILADATLRNAQTYFVEDRTVVSEALSGSYRYVKLLWLNGDSNSAVKTISEIELFAEGETPAASQAPDISSLLDLYNTVRQIGNQNKDYTATSFRNLSLSIVNTAGLLTHWQALTEGEVASAESTLRAAYDGLEKTESKSDTPDTPDTPDEPEIPDTPDDAPQTGIPSYLYLIVTLMGLCAVTALTFLFGYRRHKKTYQPKDGD
ncbi:MAG: DUF4038 domain-containing protein [Eubacteriales bacterium]